MKTMHHADILLVVYRKTRMITHTRSDEANFLDKMEKAQTPSDVIITEIPRRDFSKATTIYFVCAPPWVWRKSAQKSTAGVCVLGIDLCRDTFTHSKHQQGNKKA